MQFDTAEQFNAEAEARGLMVRSPTIDGRIRINGSRGYLNPFYAVEHADDGTITLHPVKSDLIARMGKESDA